MHFAERSSHCVGQFLLLTTTLLLISLILVPVTLVEAQERHSKSLQSTAFSETEKRYAISWWLNATRISNKYLITVGNLTPSLAAKIYGEIFSEGMELFIGGYQLKYLRLLIYGNDTLKLEDLMLLLKSFIKDINSVLGDRYNALIHKILLNTLNVKERDKYKFNTSDVDEIISLIVKLGEENGVNKEYVISIATKLHLVKLAARSGIYEDAYSELLNELLLKESILMAIIVDRAASDLGVSIVKRETASVYEAGKSPEYSVKKGPLTKLDVLRALNYTIEIIQSTRIENIDVNELLSTIGLILEKNVDIEDLGNLAQLVNNTVIKSMVIGSHNISEFSGLQALLANSLETPIGVDDVKMGMLKSNYSTSVTKEEFSDIDYYVNLAISKKTYLSELLEKLVEKLNSEKVELGIIKLSSSIASALNEERTKSIYVVQERAQGVSLIYVQLFLLISLPTLLFLVVANKKELLTSVVNAFKKLIAEKRQLMALTSAPSTLRDTKALFFGKFWIKVQELALKYNVTVAKSTTHREAYALLSSKIRDVNEARALGEIVYGYEYARYGGIEIDVEPLLKLMDSLE